MWLRQDLISELESERTNRVIAQQTANQERLQARASAAESASLRRQLNELSQQMEQEKKAAAAARLQAQQTESLQVSQADCCWEAARPICSCQFCSCPEPCSMFVLIKCDCSHICYASDVAAITSATCHCCHRISSATSAELCACRLPCLALSDHVA